MTPKGAGFGPVSQAKKKINYWDSFQLLCLLHQRNEFNGTQNSGGTVYLILSIKVIFLIYLINFQLHF